MPSPDALRLEVRRFRDLENWDWALTDAAGQHLAAHSVRIDPVSPHYQAMRRLPVHVRWEADAERLLESEAEVLGQVGRWLGEEVFGAVGRALVEHSPVTALVVVGPDAAALRHWPLELAWVGHKPLACQDVSLVIDVDQGETILAKKQVGERLRLLAVFSLSASEPLLMLSQQRYELVRSIQRVATGKASSIDLVTLQHGVTRRRLADILEEGEGWDVIHFSGHGLASGLLLEGTDGETDRVSTDELIRLLRPARKRLKLLVLSACESGGVTAGPMQPAETPERVPALSVEAARQLDCAVLGMRYAVGDDFSIQLAQHLYDSLLAKGNLLPRALQLALPKALEHWPEPGNPALSVATPALFGARAVDLSLRPPPVKEATFRPRGKTSYFGGEPDLFAGRIETMAAATKALVVEDGFSGILFQGPEATGKTACAVELAYLFQDRFDGLVRHDAPGDGTSTVGSLVGLAETLETQLPEFGPEMKDAVRHRAKLDGLLPRLSNLMDQHAIFLLIDGIDALLTAEGDWQDDMWGSVVNALLDHGGSSRLVLTSRRSLIPRPGRLCIVPVPVLSPSESLMLARQLPHLGAALRGRTEWPVEQVVPLVADLLSASGGMPGLIRAADADVLGALAARGAERRFAAETPAAAETQDNHGEYLQLVRKWTRGIGRSASEAEPPPGPAPAAEGPDGLTDQHIRLLATTARAVEDALDKLVAVEHTPLIWSSFPEADNAARRSLTSVEERLGELERQITIKNWPHADFALRLGRLRLDVRRDLTAFQAEHTNRAGQAAAAKLGISLQKLQELVTSRYPDVFSDGHAVAPAPPERTPDANELPDPAEHAGAEHADVETERAPTRWATGAPAFTGIVKLEFCRRIGPDWVELADLLGVSPHEKRRFETGQEPRALWEWLQDRSRLAELPDMLTRIGRADLAKIMRLPPT